MCYYQFITVNLSLLRVLALDNIEPTVIQSETLFRTVRTRREMTWRNTREIKGDAASSQSPSTDPAPGHPAFFSRHPASAIIQATGQQCHSSSTSTISLDTHTHSLSLPSLYSPWLRPIHSLATRPAVWHPPYTHRHYTLPIIRFYDFSSCQWGIISPTLLQQCKRLLNQTKLWNCDVKLYFSK